MSAERDDLTKRFEREADRRFRAASADASSEELAFARQLHNMALRGQVDDVDGQLCGSLYVDMAKRMMRNPINRTAVLKALGALQ